MRSASLFTVLALCAVAGCASVAGTGDAFFDPGAVAKPARVVEKKVVHAYLRSAGPSVPPTYVPVTLPSDKTVFIKSTMLPEVRGGGVDLFEYRVRTADGRVVTVYSKYFAHGVGQCVLLTESRKASYPRIEAAPAAGCPA